MEEMDGMNPATFKKETIFDCFGPQKHPESFEGRNKDKNMLILLNAILEVIQNIRKICEKTDNIEIPSVANKIIHIKF